MYYVIYIYIDISKWIFSVICPIQVAARSYIFPRPYHLLIEKYVNTSPHSHSSMGWSKLRSIAAVRGPTHDIQTHFSSKPWIDLNYHNKFWINNLWMDSNGLTHVKYVLQRYTYFNIQNINPLTWNHTGRLFSMLRQHRDKSHYIHLNAREIKYNLHKNPFYCNSI